MRNFCAVILLFTALFALADDVRAESGHVKMLLVSNRVIVAEDYSYVVETEIKYKALTEQGALRDGKFPISYNRAFSALEILQAETVKADGRRIPVPESAIARQHGSLGQLTIKDLEIVNLSLPDFAAGDSVHVRYRTRNKPIFPGHFSFTSQINNYSLVLDRAEVILDAPEKLVLQQDIQAFEESGNEIRDGRRITTWHYNNAMTSNLEDRIADARQVLPHVWVTSYADWSEVAKSALDRYTPQAAITPEIEMLAQELTAGAVNEREKAKRIYDWVRKNIRYIALYSGLDNWVPHKASDVLVNRFGDCKDHTVLMEAMLRAVGIESVPALVQADYLTFELSKVPMPMSFNHVINYVPSLDLYLDSTAVYAEFGNLADTDEGKPVVRGRLAETIAYTPMHSAAENKIRRLTRINLDEKGNANVSATIWVGLGYHDWFERFKAGIGKGKGSQNAWAEDQMKKQGRRGTATLVFLDDLDGMKGYSITQQVKDYLPDSEVGLLDFVSPITDPSSINRVTELFETERRSFKFACYPGEIEDVVEITLPDTLKLLRLPRNREIKGKVISLKVNYSQQANQYTMERHYRWNPTSRGSCSAYDWTQWLKSVREVRSAVRSASLAYERN